jgi:hypothetical protein
VVFILLPPLLLSLVSVCSVSLYLSHKIYVSELLAFPCGFPHPMLLNS